ncbi:MAG: MgtC/SapB family protein [Pseudomonadota bacterium]|nr:MgtC/SapB family protein [Pseudomonadota bacterium]
MSDYLEVTCRLVSAVLIGAVIGLDRNLHGKPSGMKTLGLVALGASLSAMASQGFEFDFAARDNAAASRVIQGIITGIGFLGAGVIVHERSTERVRGLTTAASIWVTAAIGIVCGMGAWRIAGIAMLVVLALLVLGRPLEHMLHRRWLGKSADERATIDRLEE